MRFSSRLSLVVLALALSASLLVACADVRPITTKAPNEGRLRERISEFHNALGNNDIAARYAMTSPAIRERITLEQFKKNLRRDADSEPRSKSTMQAGLSKVCRCSDLRFLRCVLVADISIIRPGKEPTRERPIETWDFADGEWYWGYMGPDIGGRCPGE